MRRQYLVLAFALAALGLTAGCNPIKRDPQNVFPGSEVYVKRIAKLKITPGEAYEIAHAQAEKDGRLHYISRSPTVVTKRTYVFSMPQGTGASIQGYHVNGDNGKVRFVNEKRTVTPQ